MKLVSTKAILESWLSPRPAFVGADFMASIDIDIPPPAPHPLFPDAWCIDVPVEPDDPIACDHAILLATPINGDMTDLAFACTEAEDGLTVVGVWESDEGKRFANGTCTRILGFDEVVSGQAIRCDATESMEALCTELERIFVKEINPSLDDPFLVDGIPDGTPVAFARGDEDAFIEALEDVLRIRLRDGSGGHLCVDTSGCVTIETGEVDGTLTERLVAAVVSLFGPVGTHYVYNDGHVARAHGYFESAVEFEAEIDATGALARAQALDRLRALFSGDDEAARERLALLERAAS